MWEKDDENRGGISRSYAHHRRKRNWYYARPCRGICLLTWSTLTFQSRQCFPAQCISFAPTLECYETLLRGSAPISGKSRT
jgi:hypothetical protein